MTAQNPPTPHVRKLDETGWSRYAAALLAVERACTRTGEKLGADAMERVVTHPDGVCYVALLGGEVAGFCLGVPLDAGTVFCNGLAVARPFVGLGVERRLAHAQIVGARAAGYRFLAGRRPGGAEPPMYRIDLEEAHAKLSARARRAA